MRILHKLLGGFGALLAAFPAPTTAQNRIKDQLGYVITTQGDTLRGKLTVPPFVTEHGLTLRANEEASTKKFGIQDLRGFGLADGRRFVRRTVGRKYNSETGTTDSATVFMQQLLAGHANFYRYNHNVERHRPEVGEAPSEAVQYFVEPMGGSLVEIRRATYLSVLPVLFKDCAVVIDVIPLIRFNEEQLSDLTLRYDTLCHASTPTHDYRLPKVPSTVRLRISAHAGLQSSQLFYSLSPDFQRGWASSEVLPTYGIELRLANDGPWSFIGGVYYSRLRNKATQQKTAMLGTSNTGEQLQLPFSLEVRHAQVPLLISYSLTSGFLRPYLAAGPVIGMYINNQTTMSYTLLNYANGGSATFREDVVSGTAVPSNTWHDTFGGMVRAGIQLKTKSRLSPTLEVQYSAGRDRLFNPGINQSIIGFEALGNLHYRTLGLTAGLEF
ncbi:hypothetical protein [Hymenobacter tenuis]